MDLGEIPQRRSRSRIWGMRCQPCPRSQKKILGKVWRSSGWEEGEKKRDESSKIPGKSREPGGVGISSRVSDGDGKKKPSKILGKRKTIKRKKSNTAVVWLRRRKKSWKSSRSFNEVENPKKMRFFPKITTRRIRIPTRNEFSLPSLHPKGFSTREK